MKIITKFRIDRVIYEKMPVIEYTRILSFMIPEKTYTLDDLIGEHAKRTGTTETVKIIVALGICVELGVVIPVTESEDMEGE